MGEARKRCRRGSGCCPCFSRLAALPLEAHAQYCTLLTKSEEKETPHSVLACFQICFVPARKNQVSFGYLIIIFLCWQASLVKMFKYWLMSSRHAGQENFSPMTVMIDVQILEGEKLRPEMRLLFTGYQPPCWPKNFGI